MILSIKDYMKHFCGKDLLEPMPGEHHFISLCLIPLMLQKLNNADDIKKLKYISPDGAKQKDTRMFFFMILHLIQLAQK